MIADKVIAKPATLYEMCRQRAREHPSKLAVTFLLNGDDEVSEITYGELESRAKTIAAVLQSKQPANKPVVLMFEAGIDFICAFMGCQYAGAIAVPVQTSSSPESWSKLKSIMEDAGANIILSTAKLARKVAELAEISNNESANWLFVDELAEGREDKWEAPVYGSGHIAFLQYTSGSTGTPKGVMVSHGNILDNSQQICQNFNTTSESICVSWLPHFHDMGLIGGIIQPLYIGCPLVLMSPIHFIQRPSRWLKAMSKYKATTTGGPNFSFDLCVKIGEQDCEGLDLSAWKVAYNGGEPVRKQTLDNFTKKFSPYGFDAGTMLPCYGLAESTLFVTGRQQGTRQCTLEVDPSVFSQNILKKKLPGDDFPALQIVSSGRAQPGTDIQIIDPETLLPCAAGTIGEVWSAGKSVTKGYWNNPEATKATMQAQYAGDDTGTHYLRTGDLGFLDDGELYITGRIKDMLIINGKNLFPQDIEQTAGNAHEQIIENGTAAFSRLNKVQKEELVLVCELKRNTAVAEFETIRKNIKEQVFFQFGITPADVVFIRQRALPRTSSGKIKRFLCKQHYLSEQLKLFKI